LGEFDPRKLGARCDVCPLNDREPVPSEGPSFLERLGLAGELIAVVGEAPGETEEKLGKPFVGKSGNELDKALRIARINRRNCLVLNTICCRPPDNDLKALLRKISRDNKAAAKRAKQLKKKPPTPTPTPIECCKPRFKSEISQISNFITLGKTATNAVAGTSGGILAVRGGLIELDAVGDSAPRKVMPTVHPAFVMRANRWAHVFRNDVFKAGKWFRGEADWVPPKIVWNPTPAKLLAFVADPDKIYTFDIETDGIECLTANIRCIAVGNENEVYVTSILGRDGFTKFYNPEDEEKIKVIYKDLFEDAERTKSGHHSTYYDYLVLWKQWGIKVVNQIDSLLLHKSVESELPHSLAYVASLYTTAPSWKTTREGVKLALGGESDEELADYCGKDVAISARILLPLTEQVRLRDQVGVWRSDQKMQNICAGMHEVGMYVNQKIRLAEEKRLLGLRHSVLSQIHSFLGRSDFNPGSYPQLRAILFDKWNLEPPMDPEEIKTSTGEISTGDIVLRSLLTSPIVPKDQRGFIKLIRRYRKLMKVLGTYVVKLRPWDMGADLGWDAEDTWADKETRERYGEVKRGIVNPRTSRMHPGWSIGPVVTGRLASSRPINAQTFPKGLRAIVTPAPGHILIGADMDQLELRIAAARWGIEKYLKAFTEGKDPHSMTAFLVFGDKFCAEAGLTSDQFERSGKLVSSCYDANGSFIGGGNAGSLRSLSKQIQFASIYMAAVEMVHQLVQKAEVPAKDPITGENLSDGTTDLPYALMPLRKVRKMRQDWLEGAPELEQGWTTDVDTFRRQGFIREPVAGRRRDFLDGEDPNQIVNFSTQGAAASLMNKALIQIYDEIPPHKWGPGTGVINQCHDSIVIECPDTGVTTDEEGNLVAEKGSIAWEVMGLMGECMNQTHPNLPGVKFTATPGLGKNWKKVG